MARVEDGEGVDDLQKEESLNDRLPRPSIGLEDELSETTSDSDRLQEHD